MPEVLSRASRALKLWMRNAGVDWEVNIYGNAEHSFTNPESDSLGIKGVAYNEKADKRSWEAMKTFFKEIFKEN
jgi:dienelactone hydrolase